LLQGSPRHTVRSESALARGDLGAGQLYSILDAIIDLILHRAIARPSACHSSSLSPNFYRLLLSLLALPAAPLAALLTFVVLPHGTAIV
jgi:hypothetical protein